MTLKNRVLDLFRRSPDRYFTRSLVAASLDLGPAERRALRSVLEDLLRGGFLKQGRRKYAIAGDFGLLRGTFHAARGGFGFVTPDRGDFGGDLYVPRDRTAGAMEGDLVAFRTLGRRPGPGRPEAHVEKVLSRADTTLVGIVQGGVFLPVGRGGTAIPIPGTAIGEGQAALVRLNQGTGAPGPLRVELLGDPDDPKTPILAAEARYGLTRSFPKEAEEEAAAAVAADAAGGFPGRTDYRGHVVVTVDPEDAGDFDDAVSIRKEGSGYRVWVHIADVSHYVRPDSHLDREAFRRGNTTYLPGIAYPMLPERLSGHLCSLRPGEDRPTLTMEIPLDGRGEPRGEPGFHRGVIRSSARLSYGEAQAILEGRERSHPGVSELLGTAREASRLLFRRRLARGTLDLDLPEADLRFGLSGKLEDVLPSVRLDSHRIIEDFMILANEAVARHLVGKRVPALYRVHDPPSAEKIEPLRPVLNVLGLGEASRGDLADPFVLQRILERASGHRAEKLISYLILRGMMEARYDPSCTGHFGLGLRTYCHFTSPIRRYPDLMVHRALCSTLGAAPPPDPGRLEAAALHCSATERRAEQAEREVVLWYQASFLRDRLGEVFEAMVLGFTRFGIRIELLDHLVEGICPYHLLAEDRFLPDPSGTTLRGRGSGAKLQVGELFRVRLIRVDRLQGEFHFLPEGWPPVSTHGGIRYNRNKRSRRRTR